MNLREMSYLVAVAELRNFSKAARYCNVSQPTLSAQIKKMEEWLNVKIFERNNKRVLVTEEGKEIVQAAKKILLEVDRIKEVARSSHSPLAGRFMLGAIPTLSTYIFPSLVPRVKKLLPDLRLILIEEKTAALIEHLQNGAIDAALVALPVKCELLEIKRLFDNRFFLAF